MKKFSKNLKFCWVGDKYIDLQFVSFTLRVTDARPMIYYLTFSRVDKDCEKYIIDFPAIVIDDFSTSDLMNVDWLECYTYSAFCEIPLALLTFTDDSMIASRIEELKAKHLIQKPISLSGLKEGISKVLIRKLDIANEKYVS